MPEQHVYDLSIEGTRNFIANDIIAHNTARYFQYKVDFNTTDARFTPILNNVSINYTINSNLSIFDDSDFRVILTGQLFNFTANFTDGLEPINGTGVNCTISHNATGSYSAPIKMDYAVATKVYFYNTSITTAVNGSFNVTCDGTVLGFNIVQAIDGFNVTGDTALPIVNTTFNKTSPKINDIINFTGNITDNVQLSTANITYNISGILTKINFTLSGTSAQISNATKITIVRNNVINFTMYAIDTSNNVKQNSTLITVANTPAPQANIIFPTNDLYINAQPLQLNATYAADPDNDVINISYYINGMLNQTQFVNTTFNASDGYYILNVSLHDNVTPLAYSSNVTVNFTIDTIPPGINFTATLSNGTFIDQNFTTINITINETNFANVTYYLWNGTPLRLYNESNFTTRTLFVNFTNLDTREKSYLINVTVRDKAGNINSTETRNITLDSIPPRIINFTSPTPANNSRATGNSQKINISITDVSVGSCVLQVHNGTNSTNLTMEVRGLNCNVTINTLDGYNYTLKAYVNDSALHANVSENWTFRENTRPEIPSLVNPANNSRLLATSVLLNYTSQDNDTDEINYIVYFDTNTNPLTQVYRGASKTFVVTASRGTTYFWKVQSDDTYENSSNSTIKQFTINTQPPIQYIITPNLTGIKLRGSQTYNISWVNLSDAENDNITINLQYSADSGLSYPNNIAGGLSNNGTYDWLVPSIDTDKARIRLLANDSYEFSEDTSSNDFMIDSTPPIITLDNPPNLSAFNNGTFINLTITDALAGVYNATWNNGSLNAPNRTDFNGTFDINTTDWGVGEKNISVFANDTVGNSASAYFRFTVTNVQPVVTFNKPSPNQAIRGTFRINVSSTAQLDDVPFVNFTYDGATQNFSMTQATAYYFYDFDTTAASDGQRRLSVYGNDSSGNVVRADILATIDNTKPAIRLDSPVNDTWKNSSVTFAYTPTDLTGILNCSLQINGTINRTNSSIVKSVTNLFHETAFGDGFYSWDVNCTDAANNNGSNSTFRVIKIDTIKPVITLIDPPNDTSIRGNHTINFTVTDAGSGVNNVSWSSNYEFDSMVFLDSYAINTTGWAEGKTNLTIFTNDSAGNIERLLLTYIIDNTPPIVTFNTPSPRQVLRGIFRVNVTSTDALSNLSGLTFAFNGSQNFTMNRTSPSAVSDYFYDWNTSNATDKEHILKINGNDTANNIKFEPRFAIVDNTAPAIRLDSPVNKTASKTKLNTFTFAVFELNSLNNCTLLINGSINYTLTSLTKNDTNEFTVNLSDGAYRWTANCTDEAVDSDRIRNTGTNSSEFLISVDTIVPMMNMSLNDSSLARNDIINVTANATDESALSFCQFIVNQSGINKLHNKSINGKNDQCSQNLTIDAGSGNVINFTVRVNDTANNINESSRIFTVIDDIRPNSNASLNDTSIELRDSVNMTANVSDDLGLSFCRFVINQTGANIYFNKTINGLNDQCSQNFTIGAGFKSVINFTIIVNDTTNNVNETSRIITVTDLTKPSFNMSLNDSSIELNEVVNVTANASDENQLSFCTFVINQTGSNVYINKSLSGAGDQCSQNFTIGVGSRNAVNFTVLVNDTANNINQSSQIVTVADSKPPHMNMSLNDTALGFGDGVNITANLSDENALSFCRFVINQTGSNVYINKSVTGANDQCSQNFTISGGKNSAVNFTVIANDTSNNLNESSQVIIIQDLRAPSLNGTLLSASSITSGSTLILRINCSDTESNIDQINFTLSSPAGKLLNRSSPDYFNVSSGSSFILNYTIFNGNETSEVGNWNVTAIGCRDASNNTIYNTTTEGLTFTVNAAAEPAPSGGGGGGAASGGGGGGGGGGSPLPLKPKEEELKDFSLSPGSIKEELILNAAKTREITIKNTGNTQLAFSLEVTTISDMVLLSGTSFSLSPGEYKAVEANIIGKRLGSYLGEIEITADGITQSINVVIDVESEQALFDAKMDIPSAYKEVKPGDELKTQITLLNVGPARKVDVTTTYIIKDSKGNAVHESSETFAVEKQTSFVKPFKIPDNLEPGNYLAIVEVRYENSFAVSSELFRVVSEKSAVQEIAKSRPLAIVLIVFIGFVLLLAYLLLPKMKFSRKKMKRKKRK